MSEIKKVDEYLKILNEQFATFGINKREAIISNIKSQILAVLKHWNNKELRNTILLFGKEEALFYEPDANIDIKSFVVVAIRNSLIETTGSEYYKEYGFNIRLNDETQFPLITKKAITFFKSFDFNKAANELSNVDINDYYYDILESYPITYEILSKVANNKKLEFYIDKINFKNKKIEFPINKNYILKEDYVVEDGYTNKFNQVLLDYIESIIKSENKIFFVESFKYLSRNFEKNIKTMEYLFQNDVSFVTFNYYISNGFISKRKEFLRPMHKTKDFRLKFQYLNGVSKKHKKSLEYTKNLIF